MQLELSFGHAPKPGPLPGQEWLRVGSRLVRLWLVNNPRARRYVLRLRPNGDARVAIPRRGTSAQARQFAERNVAWLERQLLKQSTAPAPHASWQVDTEILFRGQLVRLHLGVNGQSHLLQFADESFPLVEPNGDLRPHVERYLQQLAARELPARVLELAVLHQFTVRNVAVRNQRSRWGSCSRRATISLNWRLVQTPLFVRDYIILHELAHLKQMNHSRRFWSVVAGLCPDFAVAEHWLKKHSRLLL